MGERNSSISNMSETNQTWNNSDFVQSESINAFTAELSLCLYSIIFVLSVVGNILVILTLIREKKMRTITNLFLLNLAISDMLLSVLCMPFTLVATMLLRNFIFGEAMCIIIRYFQAVSVGVSCYTLVAISLEQYYAICQPLKSRQWQTLAHARRMILGIWLSVLLLMSPIAAFQRLIPIQTGVHACREIWPNMLLSWHADRVYSVILAVVLLLVPLILMSGYYGLIAKRLWMTDEEPAKTENSGSANEGSAKGFTHNSSYSDQTRSLMLKSTNHQRDIANRKRIIRMLFVIVLQYFVCWAPSYILSTWESINFMSVFRMISPTTKSLVLLLAYTSSFIHPITYCFMNQNFRRGFLRLMPCKSRISRDSSLRTEQCRLN